MSSASYIAYNRLVLKFTGLDPDIHQNKKWKHFYFAWFLSIILIFMSAVVQSILAGIFDSDIRGKLVECCFILVYGGEYKKEKKKNGTNIPKETPPKKHWATF